MPHLEPEPLDLSDALTTDNPLWQYALTCWQNPAMVEACLELQARGWSVTRILCAGWLAQKKQRFAGVEAAKVTEWRGRVTGRIRSARKSIPKHSSQHGPLREMLAKAELEAEKTELALAWTTLSQSAPETDTGVDQQELLQHNLLAAAPGKDLTPPVRAILTNLADHLASGAHSS
ncbi:MAG: hypothetical protein AWU57_2164 [Marinobacter sp. T13-3]|nr:MAG: hypothetical protein AWU57_2164 [Marinobacter sp. T13-3]